MDFQGILDHLRAQGVPGLIGAHEPREPNPDDKKDKGRSGDPFVDVDPARVRELVTACRDDARLRFDLLVDLTAVDPAKDSEELWVLYQLLSVEHRHRLTVKSRIPKSNPRIDSVFDLHRAAQWHERECAEMFGITFDGHPDPRNILLPDDWVGYPLRKDYEFPEEYHGISCV